MRVFLNWREETTWPWGPRGRAQDFVRPEGPLPDAAQIAAYLRGGEFLSGRLTPRFIDEITGEEVWHEINVVTDGIWMWDSSVAHYVERHAVAPLPDLLAHIREQGYVMPKISEEEKKAASRTNWERHQGGEFALPPGLRDAFEALMVDLLRPGGPLAPEDVPWIRECLNERVPLNAWNLLSMSLGLDGRPIALEDVERLRTFADLSGYDLPDFLG